MADANTVSLAVWDVPMPVVAGEMFSIKVGVKSAAARVEVCNSAGAVVASGALLETVCPQTEALYWTALDVPAPATPEVARYTVRCAGAETWFSVIASAKPEHTLMVQVSERDSKAMLDGVEIRLGPFHARTDKTGWAELRVASGDYQLSLWRTAHIAQPQPITITGNVSVALTMAHVPEEHPDARWVR